MRVEFIIKRGKWCHLQVFIDGTRVDVDAIDGISDAYGGEWDEEHTVFTIPDVPEDAIEIKDGCLKVYEPQRK